VPASANDHLMLAPINAMSKYIRNYIYKAIDKLENKEVTQ
jgi:hypothetical protein